MGITDVLGRASRFIAYRVIRCVASIFVSALKSQLLEAIEQRKRMIEDPVRGQSDDDRHKKCEAHTARSLTNAVKSMPHEAWVANLNSFLSVKRPPVMNPCL
jgi:hypothetical protein